MPASDLQPFRFTFRAMGSPCSLHFYHQDIDQANRLARSAIATINGLEQKYSRYRPDSLLSQINIAAANGESIQVDDEVLALLNYADTCYQQSEGLFDITSGVLRKAWDFSRPEQITPPDQELLDSLLAAVGWQYVAVKGHALSFLRQGMALDFGGIVKEYGADLVAGQMMQAGITSGFIELGGDIRAMGPRPDGSPWRVRIKDPRHSGRHVAEMLLYSEGLATSGDYERCVIINGTRYSHLLSPFSGWPVQGLASVTVKAPHCVVAGSSATIAMLLGDRGESWLRSLGLEFHAVPPEFV